MAEGEARSLDYLEALDDVHTRFILNLPESELETADRLMFQIEQAWWFYQDFIVDNNPDKDLPSYSNMRPFALELFTFSPLLNEKNFTNEWNKFSKYRQKISNYGCILLTSDFKKILLCKVWNGKSYTLPSGKVNQGEDGIKAAARETYEETGFDPFCGFGTTASWKASDPTKITWKPIREEDALSYQDEKGKRRTAYVVHGVPEDFPFEPVARKEVSEVEFFHIDKIPKQSFGVGPFVAQLKRWIKKNSKSKSTGRASRKKSREKSRGRNSRGRDSRGKVREGDDIAASGLAVAGDISGWSEEDMFKANEKLLGRKIEYDGNPHEFEKGFGGQDPHAFRVVQGAFLNTGGDLALPPNANQLQPLVSQNNEGVELQPFFGADGKTPWGDVTELPKPKTEKTGSSKKSKSKVAPAQILKRQVETSSTDNILLTDSQITARSQKEKEPVFSTGSASQYERDMAYVNQWVANLPKGPPTKHFGEFRLDADEIMRNALGSMKL